MQMPDLDNCTLQEACDYSVLKIVEQGKQCKEGNGCVYGDEEGNHCAIGWLLDHDNLQIMQARFSVGCLEVEYPKDTPKIISDNIKAFYCLQDFHDYDGIQMRAEKLRKLSEYIDTDKPQYNTWLLKGDGTIC